MPRTRKERRSQQRTNYLEGRARRPYTHTSALNTSLTEESQAQGSSSSGVCDQCHPILSRYVDTVKCLVHQGTELKKCKHMNPHPKRPNVIHYRDLKRQNDWLRANVFDSMGNYLYCCACIRAGFGISKQRIARQRHIKRRESHEALIEMSKEEVS